jgi:hypothetical protein
VLQQEATQPGSRLCHVRGLLQFLLATRRPGKSGQKRSTAAMMAKIAGHVWSFDELFDAVLKPATQL